MARIGLALAMLAVWACGPVDQSGGSGSGGATDAGSAGGGADGGVDAGTGSGSGGPGATLDCSGVLPPDLGRAATVTTPHGGGDVCWNATGDLSGNVAAESHAASMGDAFTGTWYVWNASGSQRGSFAPVGPEFFGQREGFI